jgi:hypothetical protein
MTNKEINSVSDVLKVVELLRRGSEEHAHLRIWFRGHGNTSWKLSPQVYRPGFAIDEPGRLMKERHLTQDFVQFSAQIRAGKESDAQLYFLQQHYGMPTRLLDWSINPLTAIFFALAEPEQDGSFLMLGAYQFAGKTGIATEGRDEFQRAMSAIFQWNNEVEWPKEILPVRPRSFDLRIVAQKGYFTFHPAGKPELTAADNTSLKGFRIPKTSKEPLRRELDLLGIDEFTIFGDLDHLASRLKRAYSGPLISR